MAEHGGSYIHVRDTLFPRQARPSYAQAASQSKTTPKITTPKKQKNVTQTSSSTQTNDLSDKNRKRAHEQSPEQKPVKSQRSLGNSEKLNLHNRYEILGNLNGTDPFNFTSMTEEVDKTPLEASNTPANSKNLQGNPPPQPSPTPDPDSVEMSPLQDDPPDPAPDSIEDHPPPPPPPPPRPPLRPLFCQPCHRPLLRSSGASGD